MYHWPCWRVRSICGCMSNVTGQTTQNYSKGWKTEKLTIFTGEILFITLLVASTTGSRRQADTRSPWLSICGALGGLLCRSWGQLNWVLRKSHGQNHGVFSGRIHGNWWVKMVESHPNTPKWSPETFFFLHSSWVGWKLQLQPEKRRSNVVFHNQQPTGQLLVHGWRLNGRRFDAKMGTRNPWSPWNPPLEKCSFAGVEEGTLDWLSMFMLASQTIQSTLRSSNTAMDNPSFVDDFPCQNLHL